MTSPPTPAAGDLPSSARLLRSTIIALVAALVILLVAVLPAEYGVDPTRVGRLLGLTQMGEIKMALAREAAAEDAADAAAIAAEDSAAAAAAQVLPPAATPATSPAATDAGGAAADTGWMNVTVVPLAPGEGKEVKLVMVKDARAQFEWSAVGGPVNFDMHGDSTGAPDSYVGYKRGTGSTGEAGELIAAMHGSHGWFWRNRSTGPVSITLRTKGAYSELKKMY